MSPWVTVKKKSGDRKVAREVGTVMEMTLNVTTKKIKQIQNARMVQFYLGAYHHLLM